MYENTFYEFIYELIYELMYVNPQNMNIIWLSGCSKYGDQGVPDPNDHIDFGFGAAAAASH